jgi:uncharacterized phage-like protein YoqJ
MEGRPINWMSFARVVQLAAAALKHYRPVHVRTGMAQGWDQAAAEACTVLGIPFTAIIPHEAFPSCWPAGARAKYNDLLMAADEIIVVGTGDFHMGLLQSRNERIVDEVAADSGYLLALWNLKERGGTYNCLKYAGDHDVETHNLWPSWLRHRAPGKLTGSQENDDARVGV